MKFLKALLLFHSSESSNKLTKNFSFFVLNHLKDIVIAPLEEGKKKARRLICKEVSFNFFFFFRHILQSHRYSGKRRS